MEQGETAQKEGRRREGGGKEEEKGDKEAISSRRVHD